MVGFPHLTDAPITEALIDFRVSLASEFDPNGFQAAQKDISLRYPQMEAMRFLAGGFEVKDGKPVHLPEQSGIRGYLFKSEDGKNVCQFRTDGFTYSRLKPYVTWDEMVSEAKSLWASYKGIARPRTASRIAVRYINHLTLPSSLSEYLKNLPVVPEGIPQVVIGFLTRVVIRDQENDLTANITESLGKSVEPNRAAVLLDIDVFKERDFVIEADEEVIWGMFARMRQLKNEIFFSILTEKAVEKYK